MLLPDLQCADLVEMADDRGIASHRDGELVKDERLDGRLSGDDAVDKLSLRLDPAVRVAIAQTFGQAAPSRNSTGSRPKAGGGMRRFEAAS
jgi:hypothetical protein